MIAKVLFITDMHKRWNDSSSIKGMLKAQLAIQNDILTVVEQQKITHIVIMGDWYDRGFHGLGQAYGAMEMDRRISASVNGNVYLCVGNHLYLERDENPELYICQPNNLVKSQLDIPLPDKPIFQLVNKLRLGNVQISFFHFSKVNKKYVAARDEGVTTHIGVYHDDCCVPGYVAEMDGYSAKSTFGYMNDIYRNVDIGMHGHIHTKVGIISYELATGRKIPLFIPGSLAITQNKESMKHPTVQLPIIEIEDDSTISTKVVQMSTHMELLRFYDTKRKKKEVITDVSDTKFVPTRAVTNSLASYIVAKGYQEKHLKLIDAAYNETLNLSTAVAIIQEAVT